MTVARRLLLLPLVPVYAAVLWGKRLLQRTGWLRTRQLPDVVISVGSVSAGGAGKTPMVLLLAEMLKRRGFAVRILTRGYSRESKAVERVDPAGSAERFGDEPMLLARRSRVPVYVGADRYKAGLMARGVPGEGMVVHLLDDGFQHRRLARDLDLVLLTRKDVEDRLLPAGDLRESLSALKGAGVIVVREEEATALREYVKTMATDGTPVWVVRRSLALELPGGLRLPERPLLFCGIARPEGFREMLEAEGLHLAGAAIFADHHRYRQSDVAGLIESARANAADGFVTTEKDAVKLSAGMRRELEQVGRLLVAELHVELVEEADAFRQMLDLVRKLNRRQGRR